MSLFTLLRHTTVLVGLAGLGVGLSAQGAPRRAVLAAGRCETPELLELARDFHRVLAAGHSSDEVLSDDAVHARIGAPANLHPDGLRLRVEAAKTLFYNGALARADEQLAELSRDVANLPPGPERTALDAETHVLRAMTFRNLDRPGDGDEELRQVLRLDPGFTLDPNDYSPALRARMDRLRRELEREPRQKLSVSSEPPGATVFVEGRDLGKTPLEVSLPFGEYTLALGRPGRTSFPRRVRLERSRPTSVRIDAGFETAIDARGFTCLEEAAGDEARIGNAIKLAILLEVEEVILVRLAQVPTESRWLTASVVNAHSAQRLREGAVPLEGAPAERRTALEGLAQFVFTGQGERVRTVHVSASDAPTATLVLAEESAPRQTWKRPVGIGAAAFGGVAAVVSTVLAFQSAATWRRFDAYYPTPDQAPSPSELPQVLALRRQAEGQRTWAVVSLSVAAAAGVTSAVLLVLEGRPLREHRAVRPVVGPGAVGVVGELP